MTAEQAMVFVRERGRAMAAASAVTPTGMSAVLGGDPDEVAAAIARHGLTAANDNGAGQVVAAGTMEQLAALAADPPAKARVIPLQVAGAFHTEHMAPAVDVLGRLRPGDHDARPAQPAAVQRGRHVVHDGREVLRRLVAQVSNPVRWDLCMQTMRDLGVTGVIEIPPAGTLADLVKRALPDVEMLALKTPDDLDAARAHGRPGTASPARCRPNPTWRLVVAPAKGTVQLHRARRRQHGRRPAPTIATVETLRDTYAVVAPHGGRSSSGWSRTATPSPPASPLSDCTRGGAGILMTETTNAARAAEARARSARRAARRTPASSASAATAPSGS